MITKIFFALIAITTITACDMSWGIPSNSECETSINNLMEQSQNFDASDIAQWLPGAWSEYSIIIYDENWETIEQVLKYNGNWDNDLVGGTNGEYTFEADGKGAYSYTPEHPPFEEIALSFAWQYDATNKQLVLSGEWNKQFTVSGFNGAYIVLDFYDTTNKHNERQILKKK